MKNEQVTIVATGAVIGLVAAMLVFFGNPANMGLCIACFLRDTAGGLGLHAAKAVQYIRPEISGLVLGALGAAYLAGLQAGCGKRLCPVLPLINKPRYACSHRRAATPACGQTRCSCTRAAPT